MNLRLATIQKINMQITPSGSHNCGSNTLCVLISTDNDAISVALVDRVYILASKKAEIKIYSVFTIPVCEDVIFAAAKYATIK